MMTEMREGGGDLKVDDGGRGRGVRRGSMARVSGGRASERADERALTGSGGKRGQPGSQGKLEVEVGSISGGFQKALEKQQKALEKLEGGAVEVA